MHEFLEELNARGSWDFVLKSFDGWSLHLSGGNSAEYASPIAIFTGVSYISCPTVFSHPSFRLGTDAERERVGKLVPLTNIDFVVAIDAETMGDLGTHVFFLVIEAARIATKD